MEGLQSPIGGDAGRQDKALGVWMQRQTDLGTWWGGSIFILMGNNQEILVS